MRWLGPVLLASGLCLSCSADRDLPGRYRDIPVPAERLRSSEARSRGRRLYLASCALCHGVRADGRGARRQNLSKAPRDFTDPAWRGRTTPRHVFHAIREGVPGTPMPAWKLLGEDETWDLVAYLLSVSEPGSGS